MKLKATRDQIVETADALFYQRGYEHTSVADISSTINISKGNLTFHFKTKDEILDAVINRRLDRTRQLLAHWEQTAEHPRERIKSFISILVMNRAKILRHGCPVGTLCSELAKLDHPALPHASQLFTLFKEWLARQFSAAGISAASSRAMHVLAWSQGIATLANAFHDEAFIHAEVRLLHEWVDTLDTLAPNPSLDHAVKARHPDNPFA